MLEFGIFPFYLIAIGVSLCVGVLAKRRWVRVVFGLLLPIAFLLDLRLTGGLTLLPLYLLAIVVVPVWAVIMTVKMFTRGWRGYGVPGEDGPGPDMTDDPV